VTKKIFCCLGFPTFKVSSDAGDTSKYERMGELRKLNKRPVVELVWTKFEELGLLIKLFPECLTHLLVPEKFTKYQKNEK